MTFLHENALESLVDQYVHACFRKPSQNQNNREKLVFLSLLPCFSLFSMVFEAFGAARELQTKFPIDSGIGNRRVAFPTTKAFKHSSFGELLEMGNTRNL